MGQRHSDIAVQIHEIYRSIQGESTWQGLPTIFVRTTGCPVRCVYCDTPHAFHGGRRMRIGEILAAIDALGLRRICVTGGEPLAQANTRVLLAVLVERGYQVSLETSGVRPIADLPRPLKVVLDLKTPGSGVLVDWLPETPGFLRRGDELKVVVTDRSDWEWFTDWWHAHGAALAEGVVVGVSPVQGAVSAADLADWLQASGLDLRLNLQLHRWIWPERTAGV